MAVTNYFSIDGEIVAERSSTTEEVAVYVRDNLGSVAATRNTDVTNDNRYLYLPHGSQMFKAGSGPSNKFLWAGTWGYRGTGLNCATHYIRARHYDATVGLWTTIDPLWPAELPFGYASQSPVANIDPTGVQSVATAYRVLDYGATPFASPCTNRRNKHLSSNVRRINQSSNNLLTLGRLKTLIAEEPCCTALFKSSQGNLGLGQRMSKGLNSLQTLGENQSYLAAIVWCSTCIETGGFEERHCHSVHDPKESSAAGLAGFLNPTALEYFDKTSLEIARMSKERQVRLFIRIFCQLSCRYTPGCTCPAIKGGNEVGSRGFVPGNPARSWPRPKTWPYLPTEAPEQSWRAFKECMESFGYNWFGKSTIPPWATMLVFGWQFSGADVESTSSNSSVQVSAPTLYEYSPESQMARDDQLNFVKIGQYISAKEYWLIGARGIEGNHERNCIIVCTSGQHLRYQFTNERNSRHVLPWNLKSATGQARGKFLAFGDLSNLITIGFTGKALSWTGHDPPEDGRHGIPVDGSLIPTFLRVPYDGEEFGPYTMSIYPAESHPVWFREAVETRRFQYDYKAATICYRTKTLVLASGERYGRRVSFLRPNGSKTFLAEGFENVVDVTLRKGRLLVYGIDEFQNYRWATYKLSDRSLDLERERVWEIPHSGFQSNQTPVQATSTYGLGEDGTVLWAWVVDGRYQLRKLPELRAGADNG